MDLQRIHNVRSMSATEVSWATAGKSYLPNLNKASLDWFMTNLPTVGDDYSKKMGRLAKDLLPNRIGALQNNLTLCVPVNWASVMQMIKQEKRERIPKSERFKVLAVICLVRTSDDKLILIKRSEKVTQYPGFYHVSAAGYVDTDVVGENELWDGIVTNAHKELKEEVNLDDIHLKYFGFVGAFEITDTDSANIDLAFFAETRLQAEEVLVLAATAEDSWEGKHHAIPIDEAAGLLETPTFVPSAAGCIAKYLKP